MLNIVHRIGKNLFPEVFAPSALKGLPPSWSGIFARIVTPPRTVHHPNYGDYRIIRLSRDEKRRIVEYQFQKMIEEAPPGSYHEYDPLDYLTSEQKEMMAKKYCK